MLLQNNNIQKDYTAYGSTGAKLTGSYIGGGGITPTGTISITANNSYDVTQYATATVVVPDNTFVVTFDWDNDYFDQDEGAWIPDATYTELLSAYQSGKDILGITTDSDTTVSAIWYNEDNNRFGYLTHQYLNTDHVFIIETFWDLNSQNYISIDEDSIYYSTSDATISSNSQLLNGIKAIGSDGTLYTGNIPSRTAAHILISGPTITAQAGYYASDTSKTISNADVVATDLTTSFSTVSGARKWNISWAAYGESPGYVYDGAIDSNSATYNAIPANTTITPSTSTQTIGGANYMMEGPITISAIQAITPTNSIINGAAILEQDGTYGWQSTVTISPGYYEQTSLTKTFSSVFPALNTQATNSQILAGYQVYDGDGQVISGSMTNNYAYSGVLNNVVTSITIPAGYHNGQGTISHTLGTVSAPVAIKGTVTNHSVTVTPSVQTTMGYIAGGTQTGTPVVVSASELVSGSQTITSNGTVDVTNLASVTVNVAGGSSAATVMHIGTKTLTISSAQSYLIFEVDGEPTSFSVISTSNISTGASPYKVASVVYDGTTHFGEAITNTSNAQVSYLSSGIYHNYNNGNLEVIINNVDYTFQAGSYALVYTYGGGAIDTKDIQVGSGATSITFTGLEDEPAYWSCAFKSNFATSNGYQRVIAVANDGTNIYGMEMDSSAKYSNAHWTASYSSGSLTITSSGTNAGGYFHQPGYYQLTYAYDDGSNGNYQTKTVTPNTTTQNITADSQYDALKKVIVNPIPSNYIIPSGNLSITSNANNIDVSEYATVSVNVPTGGGTINVAKTTWTNNSTATVSHTFSGLNGTPKAAIVRCTTTLSRSSSNQYYYIADIIWDGSSAYGNTHYRYNGSYMNSTSFTASVSGSSITFSSNASSRSSSPGSFYNGTYELTYVY